MGNRKNDLDVLLAELKRRKVFRVGAVYAIVVFAVMQTADIMVPALNLPDEFITFIVLGSLLGFPIAMVLAWSYEIVPDAVVKHAEEIAQTEMTVVDRRKKRRISGFQIIILAGVLVVSGLGWLQYQASITEPPARPVVAYVDSVAVMPVENLTGDPNYDHVGFGITEEIITHLARFPSLKVISRTSVQAVSGQNMTVPQLANALGVRHIIEGSIRLDGGGLRVTLQHINAETDAHVWAENFLGNSENTIALQEDVASQVSSRIVTMIPGLSQQNDNTIVKLGPGQEAYLRGQRWLGQRTAEGIQKAISSFTEAIELDLDYAPAYAHLSTAYALALFYRYEVGIDGYGVAARSLAMAEKSLELDPNLAIGYAARGYLGALVGQPATAVAADFERAALLQPNAANIPTWRARSLAGLGKFVEALSEVRRGIELDPLAPARYIALAELSLQLGNYDEAIAAARMATTLEPRQHRSRSIEGRSMLLNGSAEECANLSLGPHRVLRATCLDALGLQSQGMELVENVLRGLADGSLTQAGDGYSLVVIYEDLAVYYAWRDEPESALRWSSFAYSESPVGLEVRILESALFDEVRNDSDFERTIGYIRNGLWERVTGDSLQFR